VPFYGNYLYISDRKFGYSKYSFDIWNIPFIFALAKNNMYYENFYRTSSEGICGKAS
jgi:hypothetical protein